MMRASMGSAYGAYVKRTRGAMGAADPLDATLEGAPEACLDTNPWSGSFQVRYGGHAEDVRGMLVETDALGWVPEDNQGFWDLPTKIAWEATGKYLNGLNNAMPMPHIDNGRVAAIVAAGTLLRFEIGQMVAKFSSPWTPTERFAFVQAMNKLGQLIACGRYAAALSKLVQAYVKEGKGSDYTLPKTSSPYGLQGAAMPLPEDPRDPIILPSDMPELPKKFTLATTKPGPKPPDISRFGLKLGEGGGDKEAPWTGATAESAEEEEPKEYQAGSSGMMFLGLLAAGFVGSYFLK
jgi:hypothetical protein